MEIIRKIMKMTAGSISIPAGVKKIFAQREDEATAEIWFNLLENEFLCQYILCPELKPKALTTGLLALTQNKEIQEQIKNTAQAYLEYAEKQYSKTADLKNFYILELNKQCGKKTTRIQNQKIYSRVVNWLERNLDHDIMLKHTDEISDLMKIIIFTKSNIMTEESFNELFFEKKLDLIALIQ